MPKRCNEPLAKQKSVMPCSAQTIPCSDEGIPCSGKKFPVPMRRDVEINLLFTLGGNGEIRRSWSMTLFRPLWRCSEREAGIYFPRPAALKRPISARFNDSKPPLAATGSNAGRLQGGRWSAEALI